jgi:hypothetical protein
MANRMQTHISRICGTDLREPVRYHGSQIGGYRVPNPAIPLRPASSVCSAARRPLDGTPTAVNDRERPGLTARARQSRRGWRPRPRPWGHSRQARLTRAGACPLPCSHEIPEQGISPPPVYSSAEPGKMRVSPGSSPPSDTQHSLDLLLFISPQWPGQ